ncbi:probable glutamate receptor [Lineus longissimus]|uniref:probable glutamate receptor n=1 Tax=Lineus longissimus TaxID=88925 RepID=UPI002B4CD720
MAIMLCLLALLAACGSAQGQAKNRTNLIVTTILQEPFVQLGENYKLEGFIVDLLDRLTERMGCTYTLKLVRDGKYGSPGPDGKWNGMIGEIKSGEADLAAAALTMTSLRRAHIDYSYPFLANSLSVLMRRKDIYGTATEAMFGLNYFLTPFSAGVWMLIIVSFLTVSLGFILLTLFNPYEWKQRIQRGEIKDSEETNDTFGVKESLWFSYSTLVLQGYSKRPLSIAARVLAVFWMFFIILTLGSYIALMVRNPNLVLNTQSGADMTITGLRSFVSDTDSPSITTIGAGSTMAFFRNSRSPIYMKIFQKMMKTGFVRTTAQGIKRVKSEGVAFVMETTMANYIVNRDCELITLGEDFSERHYAFAMKKNDDVRHDIDRALLELTEIGEIRRLELVWWRVKSPVRCQGAPKIGPFPTASGEEDSFTKTSGLALQAFGGPLVFLLIGLIISALVCVGEILVFKHYDKSSGVPIASSDENERA